MRCDRVRDILMDYVAEELPEKMSEQVRGHLAACQLCRTELEMASKASGLLTLLGHQEEPQGIIRVPAVSAKYGVPWQRHARLQLLGAFLLVIVVCIVGGGILRSKRMPSVVHMKQPTHTGNRSTVPVLSHPPEQQSVAVDTGAALSHSVRAPKPHVRQRNKLHTAQNAPRQIQGPDKLAIASSGAQSMRDIAEMSPSSLPPVDDLPEGAIMMVSVSRPLGSVVTDGSYSYQYTEYDLESSTSIECHGSRDGKSVDIRLHSELDKEQVKGEVAQ